MPLFDISPAGETPIANHEDPPVNVAVNVTVFLSEDMEYLVEYLLSNVIEFAASSFVDGIAVVVGAGVGDGAGVGPGADVVVPDFETDFAWRFTAPQPLAVSTDIVMEFTDVISVGTVKYNVNVAPTPFCW